MFKRGKLYIFISKVRIIGEWPPDFWPIVQNLITGEKFYARVRRVWIDYSDIPEVMG